MQQAYLHRLRYVVITTDVDKWAAGSFRVAGWRVTPLRVARYDSPPFWQLATAPHAGGGTC
ncbi:MAG: hypothetical protein JO186_04475 [Actinobacteria bacterium]|nr:hypothetical protein [Actinomycetota bacterium]